jgi:hypothetical protein
MVIRVDILGKERIIISSKCGQKAFKLAVDLRASGGDAPCRPFRIRRKLREHLRSERCKRGLYERVLSIRLYKHHTGK